MCETPECGFDAGDCDLEKARRDLPYFEVLALPESVATTTAAAPSAADAGSGNATAAAVRPAQFFTVPRGKLAAIFNLSALGTFAIFSFACDSFVFFAFSFIT